MLTLWVATDVDSVVAENAVALEVLLDDVVTEAVIKLLAVSVVLPIVLVLALDVVLLEMIVVELALELANALLEVVATPADEEALAPSTNIPGDLTAAAEVEVVATASGELVLTVTDELAARMAVVAARVAIEELELKKLELEMELELEV